MKKSILRGVGMSALAVLGMGMSSTVAPTVSNPTVQSNQQVYKNSTQQRSNSTQNQFAQNQSQKITARKVEETKYGGRSYFNEGISPKTYGMYHVRRGTHKRSNI